MVEHLIEDQLDVAGFHEQGRPIPTLAFYSPHTLNMMNKALADDFSLKMYTVKLKVTG